MNTRIALLGQPNSGKSTVFNALTGSRQHVGNWPGKTVERSDGEYSFGGVKYTVTDLPGSYGLTGNSDEELITTDFIRSGQADLTCILVDASQLERSMYMVAEFAAMDAPAVLLLNMMDVAESQGKSIDAKLLEKRLGIPVLPFVAAEKGGYDELKALLARELKSPHRLSSVPEPSAKGEVLEENSAKFAWVSRMLEGVSSAKSSGYTLSKLDKLVLKPVAGKFVCVGIILLAFLVAMIICIPFMSLGSMIPMMLHDPIDGLLSGIGVNKWLTSIFSSMLPNVLYFSVSMAAFVFGVNMVFGYLEEVGFLARAAYQFDGLLSGLGLQGKAIAPILMGFGCTIGGACGTRVMDNWGQRMLAMAVVWAVPCGSIWAMVPVVSGMFFSPLGTLLVCFAILAYMVLMMVIVSRVFGRKLSPESSRSGLIMELPPYHKAHWRHIVKEAFMKAFGIFKRALGTVTLVSLFFWALSFSSNGDIAGSLLYRIGTAIEPVTRIFGLGWQTFMAFLTAGFAKEAVLGVLNAIFTGQGSIVDMTFKTGTVTVDNSLLGVLMTQTISKAEALAFIFASTFSVPCVMALSTTYRESHSLAWTAKIATFYIGCALILAGIVYHIAVLFI